MLESAFREEHLRHCFLLMKWPTGVKAQTRDKPKPTYPMRIAAYDPCDDVRRNETGS